MHFTMYVYYSTSPPPVAPATFIRKCKENDIRHCLSLSSSELRTISCAQDQYSPALLERGPEDGVVIRPLFPPEDYLRARLQYVRQIFGHFFFALHFRVKKAKTCRGKTSFALFFMLEYEQKMSL